MCHAYDQELVSTCEFFEKLEDLEGIVWCVHSNYKDEFTECECDEAKTAALIDYKIELL